MKKLLLLVTAFIATSASAATDVGRQGYFQYASRYAKARVEQLTPGTHVYWGDSITARRNVTMFTRGGENLGLGSATSSDIFQHLGAVVPKMENKVIHLMFGINDIALGQTPALLNNVTKVADLMHGYKVYWTGVMYPTRADLVKHWPSITRVNRQIQYSCAAMAKCTYIPPVRLSAKYYTDGLHPTPDGYLAMLNSELTAYGAGKERRRKIIMGIRLKLRAGG